MDTHPISLALGGEENMSFCILLTHLNVLSDSLAKATDSRKPSLLGGCSASPVKFSTFAGTAEGPALKFLTTKISQRSIQVIEENMGNTDQVKNCLMRLRHQRRCWIYT